MRQQQLEQLLEKKEWGEDHHRFQLTITANDPRFYDDTTSVSGTMDYGSLWDIKYNRVYRIYNRDIKYIVLEDSIIGKTFVLNNFGQYVDDADSVIRESSTKQTDWTTRKSNPIQRIKLNLCYNILSIWMRLNKKFPKILDIISYF